MESFFALEFFFVIICVFAFFYVLHRIDPNFISKIEATGRNKKKILTSSRTWGSWEDSRQSCRSPDAPHCGCSKRSMDKRGTPAHWRTRARPSPSLSGLPSDQKWNLQSSSRLTGVANFTPELIKANLTPEIQRT